MPDESKKQKQVVVLKYVYVLSYLYIDTGVNDFFA